MKVVVVYESMFGNTRAIAEAIGEGLAQFGETRIVCVANGDMGTLNDVEFLVVGGPTHAWSMSRPRTRRTAPDYAGKPGRGLTVEPGADQARGVREWLASLPELRMPAAAFDTRINKPSILTGRASKAIARALVKHGAPLAAPPESFLVDPKSHLLSGEKERARSWGSQLGALASAGMKANA